MLRVSDTVRRAAYVVARYFLSVSDAFPNISQICMSVRLIWVHLIKLASNTQTAFWLAENICSTEAKRDGTQLSNASRMRRETVLDKSERRGRTATLMN
jgi:hypothetical protein